jgi:nucleoside-triphosphatase THEP1
MKIAAILYDGAESQRADALIAELATRLRAQGFCLAGAIQSNRAVPNRGRCDMMLEDLATGQLVKASQDRGALANGCRLDSSALEESVGLAASSLGRETDFVIINRFGKQEAEGRGFRGMIEQAVLLDVPIVVGLNRAHVDSWCHFVGDDPQLLPMDLDAVTDWCVSQFATCTCCNCQA